MIKFVKKHWQELLLAVFILVAGILRFYHINRLEFFTYDQSRDALFVKRMIVDHEPRLLGTQTSLPGMYLPPFYYYTIAVVLWISNLNPVGVDVYSALIGVLTVPLAFYVANKVFGKPAGVFSAGLFAVSPLIVELTRRAWNPNTLPFFILIAFWFFFKYYQERKTKDFLLGFVFYGYCLSLHFGVWTMFPLVIFTWLYSLFKDKNPKILLGAFLIILFFVSPLVFFELRHNFFLVSQAKIFFFDGGHIGTSASNLLESFFSSLVALFTILISGKILVGYEAPFEFSGRLGDLFSLSRPISVVAQKPFSLSFQWWGTLIFGLILGICLFYLFGKKKKKENLPVLLILIWIFWGVFASRLYSGPFFFFYYLFVFPAPILLFGLLFKKIWEQKWGKFFSLGFFVLIFGFHLKNSTVFLGGWRNFDDLKAVGLAIAENVSDKSFNIATIQKESDRWDRNAVDYRYFTETYGGKRALGWYPQDYRQAEELFVVDETGGIGAAGSNAMEIEEFGPGKETGRWELEKGIVLIKFDKREER